jgi:hypothetical protein
MKTVFEYPMKTVFEDPCPVSKNLSPEQSQDRKQPGNNYVLYLMYRFGVSRSEIHEIVRTTGISERRIAEFLHKRDRSLLLGDHSQWRSLELRCIYAGMTRSRMVA